MVDVVSLLIVLFVVAASGFSSYFIGRKIYSSLAKGSIKNAAWVGIVTGILSFIVILVAIAYVILRNIEIHR